MRIFSASIEAQKIEINSTGFTLTGGGSTSHFGAGGSIPDVWLYNYHDSTTTCMDVSSAGHVSGPLYVRGDLCIREDSRVTGSPVHVRGVTSINSGASIGTSSTPIGEAHLVGGCIPGPQACTSAHKVYANSIDQYDANTFWPMQVSGIRRWLTRRDD